MCGNVTLVIATLGQTQLNGNEHLQSGVWPRVTLINGIAQHKTIYPALS